MSVLIVGSTALDSIKTPKAENPRLLGGSASHAAVAASFFSPVKMVGVVGHDFPKKYLALYRKQQSATKNSPTTTTLCQIIGIPKEWEGHGETTIRTISRQHTGGAMEKRDLPEWND